MFSGRNTRRKYVNSGHFSSSVMAAFASFIHSTGSRKEGGEGGAEEPSCGGKEL